MSQLPEYSAPFKISPAPKPVPKVKKTMFRQPRPAPYRHSATAQASASLRSMAGAPVSRSKYALTGTSSQPGRLGGERITPRRLSSGPPQLMPIPAISPSGTPALRCVSRRSRPSRASPSAPPVRGGRGLLLADHPQRLPFNAGQGDGELGPADINPGDDDHH